MLFDDKEKDKAKEGKNMKEPKSGERLDRLLSIKRRGIMSGM